MANNFRINNGDLAEHVGELSEIVTQTSASLAEITRNPRFFSGNTFTEKLKNCMLASENGTVSFDLGSNFDIVDKIQLPKNCKIKGNGATVNFRTNTECFLMNDNTTIEDMTINQFGQIAGGDNGQMQCPIVVGEYFTTVGRKNVKISNLIINTERINGNGILITSDSSNIIIENVNFPNNLNIGRPILIHWGNYNDRENLTTHPHNIIINNVTVEGLNLTARECSALFISGAYNIEVNNLIVENTKSNGVFIYPGDIGFKNADTSTFNSAFKSITFNNCNVKNTSKNGYHIVFKSSTGEITEGTEYDLGIVFNNCTTCGDNNVAVGSGFHIEEYAKNITLNDCVAQGHSNGVATGQYVKNLNVNRGTYFKNQYSGVYVGNYVGASQDCVIDGARCFDNGQLGSALHRSGVTIYNSDNTVVRNCILGSKNEKTQLNGIKFTNQGLGISPRNAKIYNNHTIGVASGGIAYDVNASDLNFMYDTFKGNTAPSNIQYTNIGGFNVVDINARGNREGYLANKPGSLNWVKGDKVYNMNFTSGGYLGWICVSTGTATDDAVIYPISRNTLYNMGNIRFFENRIYKATTSGRTATSTPPTHTSGTVIDGEVIWEFQYFKAIFKGFGLIEG